ncbi:unnamed protein product [Blepharisma stoltei]|uniref:Acetyl-CoA acetyltransferase n=1 Tax=Blepharisma stoltei TaxID=1481888 RepID=A0AAU9J0U4_9CILI|nr:unnamed protein product [Blepharisma stoltei]
MEYIAFFIEINKMSFMPREVIIAAAKRTPIGSYMGSLSKIPAVNLGASCIKAAIQQANIKPSDIQEVMLGNMFGGLGQAPARQASIYAGLPYETICTGINKACSSGMKSVTLAAQSITLGHVDVIMAGGIENMSLAPFYIADYRPGHLYADSTIFNLLSTDGVYCKHSKLTMGLCSEKTIEKYGITREEQDSFCAESYRRAEKAWKRGFFNNEIVPIEVQGKGGNVTVTEDDEYKKVKYDKIPTLKPVFDKNGTITAANASGFNDGGSTALVMSIDAARKLGVKPLARIVSFADGETEPMHFGTAPTPSIQMALKRAKMTVNNVDLWEINENFSSIAIVNMKLLGISHDKLNINGGAVALGHPFAMSGCRIIATLINSLRESNKTIGCASICNGGGGATSIIIELIN